MKSDRTISPSTCATRRIAKAHLPPNAIVAAVGTGTGFVAAGLASRAARVIGFDASPEMLAVARRNLAQFNHVEYREAVGDKLPVPGEMFDGVFANMRSETRSRPSRSSRRCGSSSDGRR